MYPVIFVRGKDGHAYCNVESIRKELFPRIAAVKKIYQPFPCILIVVYVFLTLSMYSYCSSMYSYLCLCILIVVHVFLDAATLTEVFPCFFLGCKANARV